MSHDDEAITNESRNPHINDLIDQRLQDPKRRRLFKSGMGLAALGFIGSSSALLAACGGDDDPAPVPAPAPAPAPPAGPARPSSLGFNAVAKSTADTLAVAGGYTASVLFRLGDPMNAATPAYGNVGTDAPASFEFRAGDHHDGMHYFGLGANNAFSATSSDRGLLVQNHEAITTVFLHPTGQTIIPPLPAPPATGETSARTVPGEVQLEFFVHGVSVIEVQRTGSTWSYKQDSTFNRRVHTLSETILSGPAAGTAQMITKYSTNGTRTRGTVNNCANGYTPWYTYLACEENWAGYFRRITATDNPNRTAKEIASFNRYGVAGNGRELWATVTPDTADNLYGRWNAMKLGASADGSDDYRNAANTYGWNVEIDPFSPTGANATPKKRTAMGRFAHEGAWPAKAVAGKPVVFYMGCDSRNEYIYKYVSTAVWDPADATRGMAAGDKYLDAGKLYVAKFNADGTGQWLELTFGVGNVTAANPAYAFADQADVLINTRLAADAQGATKMDRPEWGAVDPVNGDVYLTLTNTNADARPLAATDAANPRFYNDPKGAAAQRGNPNGHIIRWRESSPEVLAFNWDIFLFGARSTADATNVNVSALTADNDFSSPDGLWFSTATNVCWIQTDDGAYTDVTNCMLLAALPGGVGDGGPRTITSVDAIMGTSKQTQTYVAAPQGTKLRRFLVGPKDCEITGIAETPDGTTLFVNVQHPGENSPAATIGDPNTFTSHWPDGGAARPRSATIVITKNGAGAIGV